jgi:hypothetical protein
MGFNPRKSAVSGGLPTTPEQKLAEQNRNSQEQKTPSAAAARPTQKPEAPLVPNPATPRGEYGVRNVKQVGNTVAWSQGGKTQSVSSEDNPEGVRRVAQGYGAGNPGAVSYLPSAPVKSMQEQNANVANGGGYSNEAMHAQGMNRLRAGLPYSEADYKAHMENERKTQLEDAALRGNDAALKLLGIGVERDKVTTDADVKRESNAGLKSYWDGKLGVEREQLAAQERIAKTKGAPDVKSIPGQVPYGRDKDGNPIMMDSGDYVQDGVVVPGLGRLGALDSAAGEVANRWAEENSGLFRRLLGMNPSEEEIQARKQEELQRMAPGYGVFR